MKVTLERTFPLPAPAQDAWALLQDVERVAGCMPGATITERRDAQHFRGTVAVRFGPASLAFRGEVTVLAVDPATRTLRLNGKGTDTTGGSGATLDLTARVESVDAAACRLIGHSEVTMSGKVAVFGARVADGVAEQVLRQFAANFAAALATRPPAAAEGPVTAVPAAPAPARPLNGLALLWGMLRSWLRSRIGPGRA